MHPDMSEHNMASSLAFIVKRSRILDWSLIDLTTALTLDYRYVERNCVFSKSEVKDCVGSTKYHTWFASRHRQRMTFLTLEDALKFLVNRARDIERYSSMDLEGFEHAPNIFTKEDIDELFENEIRRIKAETYEIKRHLELEFRVDEKGQIVLFDPPPMPPVPIETPEGRLEDAIRARDKAHKEFDKKRAKALAERARLREAETAEAQGESDPSPS